MKNDGGSGINGKIGQRPSPLIISHSSQRRLMKPPSMRTILEATEKFAPRYDEWMRESHHPIALEILRKYSDEGLLDGAIAEVGCGTGVLSANLMRSVSAGLISPASPLFRDGEGFKPVDFVLLDLSDVMIDLARANIRDMFERFVEYSFFISPRITGQNLRVNGDGEKVISLMLEDRALVRAHFACTEAKNITVVGEEFGVTVRTAILAYVMHWMRGMSEKLHVADSVFKALPSGGRLVSVEESPLVVRCDLHPDDADVQELARLIEKSVTVLQIPDISGIFQMAGFGLVPTSMSRRKIDEYHDMYGMVFEKE